MRIAIIDERPARAAAMEEGLVARIEALSPDVVLIDLANPQRDELEELFTVSRAISRPIAMFVDQADDHSIEAERLKINQPRGGRSTATLPGGGREKRTRTLSKSMSGWVKRVVSSSPKIVLQCLKPHQK